MKLVASAVADRATISRRFTCEPRPLGIGNASTTSFRHHDRGQQRPLPSSDPVSRMIARVDLGIAVDTEGGVIIPVLRKGARDTSGRVARRDQYAVEFGRIGGRFASLIIVPPQTAIKAPGRFPKRSLRIWTRGALRRLLALPLDHRVMAGG